MASGSSRKRKAGPRGSDGVFVKKTKEVRAAVAAASPVQNATEPSPSMTAPVNSERPPTSYDTPSKGQPIAAAPPKFNAAKASPPTSARQNSKPSLTEYWNPSIWQRFTKTAVITLIKSVQCLGLKPTHGPWGIAFPRPVQQSLSGDIDAIATKLYAKLSTEELIRCAADPDSLDEELGVILNTYAPEIWSIDVDRRDAEMLTPGEESAYEQELVYEVDENLVLLWLHLHRWVFVKAFELLRKQGGEEDVRKGVLEALGQHSDASPEEEPQPQPRTGRKRKAPEGPEVPRKRGAPEGFEMSKKGKAPATAKPLTNAFMDYVNGFGKPDFSPDKSLKHLKLTLDKTATALPDLLAGRPNHAEKFAHVLAAWITFQEVILDVLTSNGHTPSLNLSPIALKVWNSRLLTQLRKARDDFVSSSAHAEDFLVGRFGALQSSLLETMKLEQEIFSGFRKLNKGLVRLGDELKEGGGEWVMMGPSSCPIEFED